MDNTELILNLMKPQLSEEQLTSLKQSLEAVNDTAKVKKSNQEIIEAYVRNMKYKDYSQETIDRYLEAIRKYANDIDCDIIDVDWHKAQDYIMMYRETRKISPVSTNNLITYLSAFYNFIVKEEWMRENPFSKIDKVKVPKKRKEAFTDEEIEKLRESCTNKRDRALIEFLLATGCRRSEASKMKVEDIDFKNYIAIVKEGKGKKDRIVNFDEFTKKYLEDYLNTRPKKSEYLFTTLKRNKQIKENGINDIINALGKAAGITDCHPHKFRRTCITQLMRGGMQPELVARQAGHSSISTTLDIYTDVKDDQVTEAYHKIKDQD